MTARVEYIKGVNITIKKNSMPISTLTKRLNKIPTMLIKKEYAITKVIRQ